MKAGGVAAAVVLAAGTAGFLFLANGGTGDAEARQLVAEGAQLLDVRTREEFASGHVDGAVNIPVQELETRIAELGTSGKPIVVYCHSGRRSAVAKQMLEAAGHAEVYDLGPMSSW